MQQEADTVLANGGKVLDVESSAKFGSARIGIVLASEGWSSVLKQRYISTLTSRKWIKLAGDRFCKDGVLVSLRTDAGIIQMQSVHALDFVFDGATKRECASVSNRSEELILPTVKR